jgi:two-component system sensor histidine kinase/response regulator
MWNWLAPVKSGPQWDEHLFDAMRARSMQREYRILGVDDNATNIAILSELLGDEYQLETASMGDEAIERAALFQPDLILLDVMMTGMDGYEACRRFRQDPRLRRTRIIMASARASLADRLEAYEAGADDYVTKPFNPEELKSRIDVHLELKFVEEANELKTNLFALLRHEAGNPLSGLISDAQQLQRSAPEGGRGAALLAEGIHRKATKLQSLYDQVFAINAICMGHGEVRPEGSDLLYVVKSVVQEVQELSEARDVSVDLSFTSPMACPIQVAGLEFVFRAMLEYQLLSSAPGEGVEIRGSKDTGHCELIVTTVGEGRSAAGPARLFDELFEADCGEGGETQRLQLVIARQIVQLQGGMIHVRRDGESQTILQLACSCPPDCDRTRHQSCVEITSEAMI